MTLDLNIFGKSQLKSDYANEDLNNFAQVSLTDSGKFAGFSWVSVCREQTFLLDGQIHYVNLSLKVIDQIF